MTTITITLPDDRLRQLQELAARFHVAPEDLLRVSLEEILTRPDEAFQQAVRHVLAKNADLYRRLA
jgi:predicted transcriptional regulator